MKPLALCVAKAVRMLSWQYLTREGSRDVRLAKHCPTPNDHCGHPVKV